METQATTDLGLDKAKAQAFESKTFADLTGMLATIMAGIGDWLGLFKELAANGPATSDELADRAGLTERYVREWLASCTA